MIYTHTGIVELPHGGDLANKFQERLFRSSMADYWIGENFLFDAKTGSRSFGRGRLLLDTIKPIESEADDERTA